MPRPLKSAIAVITYRRLPVLQEMLQGLYEHCAAYPIAVFEDCGNDETATWLRKQAVGYAAFSDGNARANNRYELLAQQHRIGPNAEAFVGTTNLGVAGNSNRAIKWFMDETDADHLLLCNDDLHVLGDFAAFYGKAHQDLGPGLFCFNDFWESPTHRWAIARSRGYRVRVFHRMTGIMLSVTRAAVNKIGYFDTRFGRFGEEHCDWTNRMRFGGFIKLDGLDQMNLDPEPTLPNGDPAPPVLRHQDVPTSMSGAERQAEDAIAAQRMQEAARRYGYEDHYRPFSLIAMPNSGGPPAQGIPVDEMKGYVPVQA